MAKAGKQLMRLRTALKKINSFGKVRRGSTINTAPSTTDECHVSSDDMSGTHLHTVYVGKTLRPYKVSSQVLDHPVIKQLVGRSDGSDDETIVIGCEVVLFEHLLWLLQTCDLTSDSLDDLVGFYAY